MGVGWALIQSLTAGAQGLNRGKQQGQAMQQQLAERALHNALIRAQTRNYDSEAAARLQPKADDWEYDEQRGVQVNKRTGQVRSLQGLPERAKKPPTMAHIGGKDYRLNEDTNTWDLPTGPDNTPIDQTPPKKDAARFTGADGKEYTYEPDTRVVALAKGVQPGPKPHVPDPSGAEQKNAGLYEAAVQANAGLSREKIPRGASRLWMNAARAALPNNNVTGDWENYLLNGKQEQFKQAGDQFADMVLRFTSGANTPEQEVRKYVGFLVPQGGEADATLQQKEESRAAFLRALQKAGGDAIDPNTVVAMLHQFSKQSGGANNKARSLVDRALGR